MGNTLLPVDLYPMSIFWIAVLLDLPSLCVVCSVLLRTFLKHSASQFARGCSGVTRWYLNPISSANALNSTGLKSGLLSHSSLSGIPCVANTFLSLSQVTRHDVEVVCYTAGNLVLLSITTRL